MARAGALALKDNCRFLAVVDTLGALLSVWLMNSLNLVCLTGFRTGNSQLLRKFVSLTDFGLEHRACNCFGMRGSQMRKYLGLMAKSVLYSGLVVIFFVIQGCSNKDFTPANGGILTSPDGSSNGFPNNGGGTTPGDGSGTIPTNGTPTPTPGGSGGTTPGGNGGGTTDPLPKMTIEEPLCGPFRDCPAYFVLTAPAAKTLTFTWRTNDTLYTSDPARVAQPGVHYVSTSGSVSFAVGEQRKGIIIKSLSITSMLVIPFIYSNCVWGGVPISCAQLPL